MTYPLVLCFLRILVESIRWSIKCKKWDTRCRCNSHENNHNLLMGIITKSRIVSPNPLSNALYMSPLTADLPHVHLLYRAKPIQVKAQLSANLLFIVKMECMTWSFRLILYYSPKSCRCPQPSLPPDSRPRFGLSSEAKLQRCSRWRR